jgi:hypothetical protein
VKDAVSDSRIDQRRYESYLFLVNELQEQCWYWRCDCRNDFLLYRNLSQSCSFLIHANAGSIRYITMTSCSQPPSLLLLYSQILRFYQQIFSKWVLIATFYHRRSA